MAEKEDSPDLKAKSKPPVTICIGPGESYNHAYYVAHQDLIKSQSKAWRQNNRERYNKSTALRRQRPDVKTKRRLEARAQRKKNPQKIRERHKGYYHKNPDLFRKRRRDYYWENREKELKALRLYGKKNRKRITAQRRLREKSDPVVAIIERLRRALVKAVARYKTCKSSSTIQLLGCTPIEFHDHLESLFLPGMSWDNRSKWHVDHKRPIASFDMKDPVQQRIAWHFSNLQPLWAHDNRSKGSRYE